MQNAIWNSEVKATYHRGKYLSGWQVFGEAGKILEDLGVAQHVKGWGTLLDGKLVQALSSRFTFAEAKDYMAKKIEEEARVRMVLSFLSS